MSDAKIYEVMHEACTRAQRSARTASKLLLDACSFGDARSEVRENATLDLLASVALSLSVLADAAQTVITGLTSSGEVRPGG